MKRALNIFFINVLLYITVSAENIPTCGFSDMLYTNNFFLMDNSLILDSISVYSNGSRVNSIRDKSINGYMNYNVKYNAETGLPVDTVLYIWKNLNSYSSVYKKDTSKFSLTNKNEITINFAQIDPIGYKLTWTLDTYIIDYGSSSDKLTMYNDSGVYDFPTMHKICEISNEICDCSKSMVQYHGNYFSKKRIGNKVEFTQMNYFSGQSIDTLQVYYFHDFSNYSFSPELLSSSSGNSSSNLSSSSHVSSNMIKSMSMSEHDDRYKNYYQLNGKMIKSNK